MPWVQVVPVVDPKVRSLCSRPYEGHPSGCPNFKVSPRCPPEAPLLGDVFDLDGPVWAVYSVFPLGEHVARMRVKHPGWSDRQLGCVLYWQGTARKRLRAEVEEFRGSHPDQRWVVEATPEAMGCDVTATMKAVGVELPWPPVDVAYHVALAGTSSCYNVSLQLGSMASGVVREACRHVFPGREGEWCSGCRSRVWS